MQQIVVWMDYRITRRDFVANQRRGRRRAAVVERPEGDVTGGRRCATSRGAGGGYPPTRNGMRRAPGSFEAAHAARGPQA
jgi:hypothetical protein